jgi:Nif-specific regulatory protein
MMEFSIVLCTWRNQRRTNKDSEMLTNIKRLNQLIEINRDLSSTLNHDKLLDLILTRITQSIDAEASSIILMDDDDRLTFISAIGEMHEEIKKMSLRRGEGIAGWVIENGKPVLVEKAEEDSRFHEDISKELSFPTRSMICVPLKLDNRTVGAIEVINSRSKSFFDQEDMDFLTEFSHQVAIALRNAKIFGKINNEVDELKSIFDLKHEIIGSSKALNQILRLVQKVAPKDIIVLITGKSGTGKEMIARAIHESSPRRHNVFVSVNCAAIPEELLESELFGHERGAFTGAVTSRKGKFEQANGGTLFLDEIGDMSLRAQAKVLRVIQDQIVQHVGGNREIKVNTRIVAATNKDLIFEIREGNFREDLYYRLNEITVELPPLEERREDIGPLAEHFIKIFDKSMNKNISGISRKALQRLYSHSWPGNVRELKNIIKRAMVFADGEMIDEDDLSPEVTGITHEESDEPVIEFFDAEGVPVSLSQIEKDHIERALIYTGWNKKRACEILEINRPRLDRKLKTYNINRE